MVGWSSRRRMVGALVVVVVASGCQLYREPRKVDASWQQALRGAQASAAAGEWVTARGTLGVLERVRPGDPRVAELMAQVPPEVQARFDRPWLGSNVAKREEVPATWLRRALLWLPDRLLDALDLVSFEVAMGPGLLVDVHATHAVQLAAGGRATLGAGWHEGRSLGIQFLLERGAALPAFGDWNTYAFRRGTGPSQVGAGRTRGWRGPDNPLFHDLRDYWAVGAGVHVVYVGASVDLHPVQLFDLLAGVIGFDPLGDDLATTRGQEFDRPTFGSMQANLESLWHEPTIRDFRRWDEQRRQREAERAAQAAEGAGEAPASASHDG